ncbi:MAG TPA: hypothetical protein P5305_00590 [Rubrivivax sp.]|nr:hypothetical protein [Rubrivivax sp.]
MGVGNRVAAQQRTQLLRHLGRDLVLQVKDACEPGVEAAAPSGAAVAGAQQAGGDAHLVAAALPSAVDDPVRIEFARGAQRILVHAGIAQHRTARAHHQPGHGRQPRRQAVGHADLQQFVSAFAQQWLERQHGQRGAAQRNFRGRTAAPSPTTGAGQPGCRTRGQREVQPSAPVGNCDGLNGGSGRGWRSVARRTRCCDRRCRSRSRRGRLHHRRRADFGQRPDRGDEPEAAPRHGLDEAAAMAVIAQCAAQSGNHLAQVVLLDHQARPQAAKQGVLVEQQAGALHEQQQRVEQPWRQWQLGAVWTQHALLRPLQHEVTEGIALDRRHRAISRQFQATFKAG